MKQTTMDAMDKANRAIAIAGNRSAMDHANGEFSCIKYRINPIAGPMVTKHNTMEKLAQKLGERKRGALDRSASL